MKILGIIPARKNSKGLPGKNKVELGGKPLIAYTFSQALNSRKLSSVICTTDDLDIVNIASDYGIEVPFVRPNDLACDDTKSVDVIKHALIELEKSNRRFDAICLLQPTSPFRPSGTIDKAIDEFCLKKYDSLISLRKIPDHYNPFWAYKFNARTVEKVLEKNYNRRQDLPITYHRDGAIYLSIVNNILKRNRIIGPNCGAIEINSPELINIDTIDDLEIAKKYLKLLS